MKHYAIETIGNGTNMDTEKTLFETLQEQYPNKEIRLVMDKFVQAYLLMGYKIVHTDVQKSEVSSAHDIKYCFMLAPTV